MTARSSIAARLNRVPAEIFPTFVRATAAGTAYGLSRLSSAAMPFVLVPVLDRFGPTVTFAVVATAMGIVVVDIGLFAPRTTGLALECVNPPRFEE